MSQKLEFFFDFVSPYSYLAHSQLPGLHADVVLRPMHVLSVMKEVGNTPTTVTCAAKGRYAGKDLARWARRYGVPFAQNPHFPINTLTLMRGAVGLQMRRPADFERYVAAVYRAMWVEPQNLGDAAVLAAALQRAGFDVEALLALVNDPEVKARLVANTDEAVARGVFEDRKSVV